MMNEGVYNCDLSILDVSQYPVVVSIFHNVDPNEDQVREYVNCMSSLIEEREGSYVVIVDITHMAWINAQARILMNKLTAQVEKRNVARQLKTIVITRSIFQKIALQGFNRVNKPLIPQIVSKSLEEAHTKAREILNNAGIE